MSLFGDEVQQKLAPSEQVGHSQWPHTYLVSCCLHLTPTPGAGIIAKLYQVGAARAVYLSLVSCANYATAQRSLSLQISGCFIHSFSDYCNSQIHFLSGNPVHISVVVSWTAGHV